MTVEEILDILDQLGDDEREEVLRPLIQSFTKVSLVAMKEVQDRCKTMEQDYSHFIKVQNSMIRQCVEMEVSDLGKMFRNQAGEPPLTMETDVGFLAEIP